MSMAWNDCDETKGSKQYQTKGIYKLFTTEKNLFRNKKRSTLLYFLYPKGKLYGI